MTTHPTCKLENTIFRGGWEAKGYCRAFCYIGGILEPISTGGKALSGWRDSRVKVHQPDCTSLPSGNETKIENLIIKLFHCSVCDMHPRGKLWSLAICLFSTFLMHLSEMRVKYPEHMTLRTVAEKSQECGLSLSILLEWGTLIRNKFDADNIVAVINDGGSLLPLLLERIVVLEKNARVQHEVIY